MYPKIASESCQTNSFVKGGDDWCNGHFLKQHRSYVLSGEKCKM